MRWLAVLMVVACGSGTPQRQVYNPDEAEVGHVTAAQPAPPASLRAAEPTSPEIEERKAKLDAALAKVQAEEDADREATYAAISDVPPAPPAKPAGPYGGQVDVDVSTESGPGDVKYDDAEAEADPQVEYEDGVPIHRTDKPGYCLTGGRRKGFCFTTLSRCQRSGGPCSSVKAFACFAYTARTSGEMAMVCTSAYGTCDAMAEIAVNDAEYTDVRSCVIWRVQPKKKPAKKR